MKIVNFNVESKVWGLLAEKISKKDIEILKENKELNLISKLLRKYDLDPLFLKEKLANLEDERDSLQDSIDHTHYQIEKIQNKINKINESN